MSIGEVSAHRAQSLYDRASIQTDFSGLDQLRQRARADDPEALKVVARQFEGLLLNMMLKSMRAANEVFREDSMFSSSEVRFYEDMLDQQMSSSLSERSQLGLASLIERQLSKRVGPPPERGEGGGAGLLERAHNKKSDNSIINRTGSSVNNKRQIMDGERSGNNNKIDAFVNGLLPIAKDVAAGTGMDPHFLIAQAALESGWGEHVIQDKAGQSSHNLFGIKAGKHWQGDTVSVETTEYRQGQPIHVIDRFRKYESERESMKDYLNLIQGSPRYQKAWAVRSDSEQYAHELQSAGYATDPNYAKKILSLLER